MYQAMCFLQQAFTFRLEKSSFHHELLEQIIKQANKGEEQFNTNIDSDNYSIIIILSFFHYDLSMKNIILIILLLSITHSNELNDTVTCINQYVSTFKDKMNPTLYEIFAKAFPNSMSTTIQHFNLTRGNESVYIITGDIEAMWLRDSTNQFIPYIRMLKNCTHMPALTRGLLNTQAELIMIDGYTNAFKKFETSKYLRPLSFSDESETLLLGIPVDLIRKREFATQHIWERKWEIDSPAAFLRLAHQYSQRFGETDMFNIRFFKAISRILSVLEESAKDTAYEEKIGRHFYTFRRNSQQLPKGTIKYAVYTGMIKTGFRPSDSPNELPFNIPGNAMMAAYLRLVAEEVLTKVPAESVFNDWSLHLTKRMLEHAAKISEGIYQFGIVRESGKDIFAYEVDGLGNYRLYDDSNLPSLLSLAYLKFVREDDAVYKNTRNFILSEKNKYFYSRGDISGVGSSHTSERYIWPLALTIQILTSKSNTEIRNCLSSLIKSAKNNLMHESFSVDNPSQITREWFAWANSFFGEMIMHLALTNPSVLK